MPAFNQKLFSTYLTKYSEISNTAPFCYGSRATSSSEAARILIAEGADKTEIDQCVEKHRSQSGKLWNYTGD